MRELNKLIGAKISDGLKPQQLILGKNQLGGRHIFFQVSD
jgi:hypothetical protein